jgi:hypothetical protein
LSIIYAAGFRGDAAAHAGSQRYVLVNRGWVPAAYRTTVIKRLPVSSSQGRGGVQRKVHGAVDQGRRGQCLAEPGVRAITRPPAFGDQQDSAVNSSAINVDLGATPCVCFQWYALSFAIFIYYLVSNDAHNATVNRLWLVAIAPFIASFTAYYFYQPEGRVNYGDLMDARQLTRAPMTLADGAAFSLKQLEGKWLFVVADDAACDAYCEKKLWQIRQVRKTQGKYPERIERVADYRCG